MAISVVDIDTTSSNIATVDLAKANLSGLANDDLVLVFYHADVDLAWTVIPTGFNKVDELLTDTGRDATSGYFYKFMTDVDSEPATWTFGSVGVSEKTGIAIALRGVDTGGYLDNSNAGSRVADSLNPNPADITTQSDGSMVITMVGLNDTDSSLRFTGGAPSGFTLSGSTESIGNDCAAIALARFLDGAASTVVIGVWTNSEGSSGTYNTVHTRTISLAAGPTGKTVQKELQETLTLSDQVARDLDLDRYLQDSYTLSDQLTRAIIRTRLLGDSSTFVDSTGRDIVADRVLTEIITYADQIGVSLDLDRILQDVSTYADNLDESVEQALAPPETIQKTLQETFTFTDSKLRDVINVRGRK